MRSAWFGGALTESSGLGIAMMFRVRLTQARLGSAMPSCLSTSQLDNRLSLRSSSWRCGKVSLRSLSLPCWRNRLALHALDVVFKLVLHTYHLTNAAVDQGSLFQGL